MIKSTIDKLSIPHSIEAEFESEPLKNERTATLKWGEGGPMSVIVKKERDPKIFRSVF